MKLFCFSILFLAGGILLLPAQTNISTNAVNALLALVTTNQPPTTNPPAGPALPRGLTTIEAIGPAVADLNNHWVTYSDHVVVTDAQMKLTCEWLKANLPQNGESVTNIIAETNVVVDFTDQKGQKTHVTGDKGVYFFHVQNGVTNDTLTLTAIPPKKARMQDARGTITSDAIIWDRMTGLVTFSGPVEGVGWHDTNAPAGTNSKTGGNLFQLK